MKKLYVILTSLSLVLVAAGQHQELNEKPGIWKEKETETDTTSLLAAFRKSTFSGHFRYYFMATQNRGQLSDYYANATGGGIKLETGRFHNFQVGISGFFAFNIGSSDLSKPDPLTQQKNRYEIGLFDIEDPGNKTDIDRLEELYLRYHFKTGNLTAGKQLLNTPFINLQDGRMRPTGVEAVWADFNLAKKWKLQGGYIFKISPRSTVRWYSIAESIGVYPSGVHTDGTKSLYAGNLESKGIILAGLQYRLSKNMKLRLWNMFTENIFNSALLQADYERPLPGGSRFVAGAQLIRQDALHFGGAVDPAKTYFPRGTHSLSFGATAGLKNENWDGSVNYTRITKSGRYLLPREWGRDPFYTFLPRERNEGLGDVHAWVAKLTRHWKKAGISSGLAWGIYDLPAVSDFAMNKYGLPSYNQLNLDLRYRFGGILKGMDAQLLYVHKGKRGNSALDDKFIIKR